MSKSNRLTGGYILLAVFALLVGYSFRARTESVSLSAQPATEELKNPIPTPQPSATSKPRIAAQTAQTNQPVQRMTEMHTNYKARAASEWQGMLVDMNALAPCRVTGFCQRALACVEGECGPCETDSQCPRGEICALDYCVPEAYAACRRAADCERGSLCQLSGLTDSPRGNVGMRAYCSNGKGGRDQRDLPALRDPPGYVPPSTPTRRVLEQLRAQP